MKAVVAAFNQEKALVGAFSVITNLRMELFGALAAGAGLLRRPMANFAGRSWRAGGGRGRAALAADVRLGAASRGEETRALQTQPGKLCLIKLSLYVKCAESRYCLCTIDISRQYLHNVYLQFHSLENKTSMQQCVSCQFYMPNSAQ